MHKEYFVATVNRGSMHPLRGLCLCQQCHEDSELFKALFPYPMPVIELPVVDPKRPNDLNSVYQTNQRSPGCCGKTECGKQLQDKCWIATSDPRSIHSLKNVYLCTECRNEADETKYMFSTELTLSDCSVSDNRKYFLINGEYYNFGLPSSWEMYDNPSTLKEQQDRIFAQFVFDYGHELLYASLRDQPMVISKYLDAHTSLTAALPLLLSAGFKPVSRGCLPALSKTTDPTYDVIDKFCCDHCNASLSVQFVTKLAPINAAGYLLMCTTLIEKHLEQNPACQSLDKLKRECILPEFFFPDNRHSESKRKLQTALRDRVNRLTKFVKSLQRKPEFTVMPPPGDPAVQVFNPWTNTEFDQVHWNSIVPSCTYVLA
jgi:hypothetical protein